MVRCKRRRMNENEAIQKLFEGVVPERFTEVVVIVDKYSAQFRQIGDREGFNIDAGAFGAVQYTHRSMQQLWLFGYAGMLSLHCYATLIVLIQSSGLELNIEKVKKIPGQNQAEEDFSNIMSKVRELNNALGEEDFLWPEDIPKPEQGRPTDDERAAVFDLSCMAAAYVFLHELRHVMFSADGDAPESPIDEEYACDNFAKDMMTSHIKKYSEQSGYPEDKVTMKRAMGIALASSFLLFATGRKNLSDSSTHPQVHGRWLCTVRTLELPENDYFWLYFSSLSLSILQYICSY